MMQINPNVYPKGGYEFKDTDGAVIRGDSWVGVAARVKAYRKRRGAALGDVDAEVVAQACQKNPVLCSEDNGATRAALVVTTTKSRMLRWLGQQQAAKQKDPGSVQFVSQDLHDAREDVCSRCPKDKALADEGCGSCRAAREAMKTEIVGKRRTGHNILVCPVLGEYLPVSTWIEQQAVLNDDLWHECWRKRTL
jgi:hypothetical protein